MFDTVGALGIPAPFLGTLGTSRYLFHDTEPSRIINHARHAVAIDEMRQDFEPTLWSPKAGIDLKQVWFAGVHTDIGGGGRMIPCRTRALVWRSWLGVWGGAVWLWLVLIKDFLPRTLTDKEVNSFLFFVRVGP